MGRGSRPTRGQALVEFALVMPVILFAGVAMFQLIILFNLYISEINVARDAARWISVHPQRPDGTNGDAVPPPATQPQPNIPVVKSRLPSQMLVANTTITITPACTTYNTGSGCLSGATSIRQPGDPIRVTVSYDASNAIFLPTTYGFAPFFTVHIPTALPAYSMTILAEPAVVGS